MRKDMQEIIKMPLKYGLKVDEDDHDKIEGNILFFLF